MLAVMLSMLVGQRPCLTHSIRHVQEAELARTRAEALEQELAGLCQALSPMSQVTIYLQLRSMCTLAAAQTLTCV